MIGLVNQQKFNLGAILNYGEDKSNLSVTSKYILSCELNEILCLQLSQVQGLISVFAIIKFTALIVNAIYDS